MAVSREEAGDDHGADDLVGQPVSGDAGEHARVGVTDSDNRTVDRAHGTNHIADVVVETDAR